jgi:hypothetical protein
MKRHLLISAAIAIAILGTQLLAATPPPPALSLVSVRGKTLGWAGVYLEDSHTAVEARLKQRVPILPYPDALACGPFQSDIVRSGHHVEIQWSGSGSDATVESITVSLPAREASVGGEQLSRSLQSRLPSLRLLGSRVYGQPPTYVAGFAPEGNDAHELLLKVGAENVFFVSLEACLD